MNNLNSDRIGEISLYRVRIPLVRPFVTSLGPHTAADNVFVRIKTHSGITGTGECSPFMTINGESSDSCLATGKYFAGKLIGQPPEIAAIHAIMDSVIYGNNSIKSAFDMAVYDIAAQHAGLPLYRLLNGEKKVIKTDYTVSIGSSDDMAAQAREIVKNGFEYIKVKLGGSAEEDIRRIEAIRDAIGIQIPLRIDANQGWNAATAVYILQQLKKYNIQFCEEPLPRYDYYILPFISKNSDIAIMADESCSSHHDAKRLAEIKACQLFNVKLGKCGGIYHALEILRIAEKAGIYMQAGGFLESRLGFTATAHLALAGSHVIYYDMDTPLMFSDDPVDSGMTYNKGDITVPEMPGIGAVLREEYIKDCLAFTV